MTFEVAMYAKRPSGHKILIVRAEFSCEGEAAIKKEFGALIQKYAAVATIKRGLAT
jgi:hypothetical protein